MVIFLCAEGAVTKVCWALEPTEGFWHPQSHSFHLTTSYDNEEVPCGYLYSPVEWLFTPLL